MNKYIVDEIREWEEQVNDHLSETFGDKVGHFCVVRYDQLKSLIHAVHDGEDYYVEVEVYEREDANLAEQELIQFMAGLLKDYFYIEGCGCGHDCCGHAFTGSYQLTEDIIKNWTTDIVNGERYKYHLHTYKIMVSNGVNY